MVASVLFSATACGGGAQQNQQQGEAQQASTSKTLVAYFSATGTTARVAKHLAEATGGDLYEITPEQPYTDADLDWRDKKSRSTIEMQDKKSRPAIAGKVEDMARYDTIYVGFPVWWYTAPTIINTFLESYDLTGKTIIPFATSGGSDINRVHEELAPSAPGATIKPGRLLNGNPPVDTLRSWVNTL